MNLSCLTPRGGWYNNYVSLTLALKARTYIRYEGVSARRHCLLTSEPSLRLRNSSVSMLVGREGGAALMWLDENEEDIRLATHTPQTAHNMWSDTQTNAYNPQTNRTAVIYLWILSVCICKSNIICELFCAHLRIFLCAFAIIETDLTPYFCNSDRCENKSILKGTT